MKRPINFTDAKFYSRKPLPSDLTEVLDENGRPLCLMPGEVAARQALPRLIVALALFDKRGRTILRTNARGEFDLPACAPLPAGLAAADFRFLLLPAWNDYLSRWSEPRSLPPTRETGFATIRVYAARCDLWPADEDPLVVTRDEYRAILARSYPVAPLCSFLLDSVDVWPA